ncbi:MAG TPA: hypothetical protein ENJ53_01170 [Phaeodactylibacter sp.]|nr:hypothetical protein [Phaeodactylibacter sp.]
MKIYFFLFFVITIFFVNCKGQQLSSAAAPPENVSKKFQTYSFNAPDRTFDMPESLKEISGLSISPDGQQLCTVNDEQGVIFFINKKTGAIERQMKFAGHGDYEGIEAVGEKIYVVKSTGSVYEITDTRKDTASFNKTKYLLKKENDTEGLGYDAQNDRLLFACKGVACLNGTYPKDSCRFKKAIYSLDLKKKYFSPEIVFEIKWKDVKSFLKKNKTPQELEKLNRYFDPKDGKFPFHPSALGLHPVTHNIYILASKGKALIVLSPKGEILEMAKLDKKIHAQPEGITFDKHGVMFISNEGKKGKPGRIYVFKPRQAK